MKKKLFFLATLLSFGFFTACDDDNEYLLDDSSTVTPTIEIAEEDVIIQANNGSTIQFKAAIANPSGIASVNLVSAGLGLNETIEVNAPSYSLNKEFTIPAGTREGLYIVNVTVNSKNLITLTKNVKVLVGNVSDDIAPVFTLLTDIEEQFKSSVDFRLNVTDNLGLASIRIWSDDTETIDDMIDLDGIAEYNYNNIFTLPTSYSAKSVTIKAEAIDLFGNTTEMDPATFKVNVLPEELYLIGDATEAGWVEDDAIAFTKTGEGTFEVITTLLGTEYGFKFISAKDYDHGVWGLETESSNLIPDGYVGDLFEGTDSKNIPPVEDPGLYKITVDIENLTFSVNKVTFPDELFLVGGSSPAGWDEKNPLPIKKLDVGKFRIFTYLTQAGDGVKLLVEKDWAGAWGMKENEEGTLITGGEKNIPVAEDGFYAMEIDFTTMSYKFVKMLFGICGDVNGWGTPILMDYNEAINGNYTFTITQNFEAAGNFKFKWDGDQWAYNFGAPTSAGELSGEAVFDGKNINIPSDGTYDIVLNLDPDGYTYSVTKQ